MQAQTETAKVMTELTCWKCGEETLKPVVSAIDPNAFGADKIVAGLLMKSECTQCGASAVNAAQARHNKTLGRKNRKAIIKEANRKAS